MSWLNRYTAAAGALAVTIALWGSLGFPTPVMSSALEKLQAEIGRLESGQLNTAIRVYEDQMDRLIIRKGELEERGTPRFSPTMRSLERQIENLNEDLRSARQRRIQLGN